MRCHNEVLGVARDVDDDELKKAYRKAAIRHHPDKNPDNVDEATERFKEIQAAYAVLGDPHERRWYDSHREAILRAGHEHAAGGEGSRPEDEINLMPYFSGAAFRGFDDQPGGFYETYRRVFDALDWIQRAAGKQYVEFYRYYVSKSPPVATRAVAWTTRAPLCASESLSVSLL